MFTICILITLVLNSFCSDKSNYSKELNQNKLKQNETRLGELSDSFMFSKGLRSLLIDKKGNYWIGSDKEGVCKYDGKTFTKYSPENGFCGSQVFSIKEDDKGQIWFATNNGLCCYNGEKFIPADKTVLAPYYSSNSTDLWFSSSNKNELIRIDQGKSTIIKFPFEIPLKANPIDYDFTAISKSKSGDLWVAYYKGVAHFDGKSIKYINDSTMHYDGKSQYFHVRSLLEDSKGRIWIGNNGIGVLLKEKDKIINFSEKFSLIKGKVMAYPSPEGTLMHVFAIKEDSKGNIWFGDRDTGAWRYDGKEMKNFIVDKSLKTQHIWDIYEDKNGNLLFTMAENAIYKFTGNGFEKLF